MSHSPLVTRVKTFGFLLLLLPCSGKLLGDENNGAISSSSASSSSASSSPHHLGPHSRLIKDAMYKETVLVHRFYQPGEKAQQAKKYYALKNLHPNALFALRGTFYNDESMEFETEYANAGTLAGSLTKFRAEDRDQVLRSFLWQMSAVLHAFAVLHKRLPWQLNPDSLLLTSRGFFKMQIFTLIDEDSMAREVSPDSPYTAPENRGNIFAYQHEFDPAAVTWSLGALAVSIKLGRSLVGKEDCALLDTLARADYDDNCWLNIFHDPRMCFLVNHCLKLRPEERISLGKLQALPFVLAGPLHLNSYLLDAFVPNDPINLISSWQVVAPSQRAPIPETLDIRIEHAEESNPSSMENREWQMRRASFLTDKAIAAQPLLIAWGIALAEGEIERFNPGNFPVLVAGFLTANEHSTWQFANLLGAVQQALQRELESWSEARQQAMTLDRNLKVGPPNQNLGELDLAMREYICARSHNALRSMAEALAQRSQ
jgi:hypothetical protein